MDNKNRLSQLIDRNLQAIANIVLLNDAKAVNPGLDGKMGTALLFFHLSRYFKNLEYEDLAEVFLNDALQEMKSSKLIKFSFDLMELGWAIDYLVKNKFIDGGIDDFLLEIDRAMFNYLSIQQSSNDYSALLKVIPYIVTRSKHIELYCNSKSRSLYNQLLDNILQYCHKVIDNKMGKSMAIGELNLIVAFFSEMLNLAYFTIEIRTLLNKVPDLYIDNFHPCNNYQCFASSNYLTILKQFVGSIELTYKFDMVISHINHLYDKLPMSGYHNNLVGASTATLSLINTISTKTDEGQKFWSKIVGMMCVNENWVEEFHDEEVKHAGVIKELRDIGLIVLLNN